MTKQRCAVRWPACGASSACRTRRRRVGVEEVGGLGARAFTEAAALNRREIDRAGDVRTMAEAAESLTEALGRPIACVQARIEQGGRYSKGMGLMMEWFERVGYSA